MTESILGREAEIRNRAEAAGQGHVFGWWNELSHSERASLLQEIDAVDFSLLKILVDELVLQAGGPHPVELEPAPIIQIPHDEASREEARRARECGETLLGQGKVAALVVAGGQGTRLGFSGPKGAFPIAPVTRKPLFAIFGDRIAATQRRYGKTVHWFVMTSPANNQETKAFFSQQGFFGLSEDQVHFFTQGTMPAVDLRGKLLMASKSGLALSPDGHGGTLRALKASGALAIMQRAGITEISYFQVDNVLVKPLDPVFIGHHVQAGAEMSSKALRKAYREEKVGVFGVRNGKLGVVEYSDLSEGDMQAADSAGNLKYWAGSPAIHMLQVGFVERLQQLGRRLPFHRADKKVPHIDQGSGSLVQPDTPNGVKFECFIFDALGEAANPVTMEVLRNEEFSPVKNAEGLDSPETARRDLMELFASWLKGAGVEVPRRPDGTLVANLEISPLFALDREEAVRKVPRDLTVSADLLLE